MRRGGRSSTDGSAEPTPPPHAGGGVGHPDDRLSALPDDLLRAILSSLKARQMVRTCVLSARWRHLWRSVPRLDVDQREFGADSPQSFKNFAHALLHRHDVELLDEFRLHVSSAIRAHADSWVRRGISQDDTWLCRLKSLHLCNVCLDNYFARHVASRCPAMEDMELRNYSYLFTDKIEITSSSLKKLVVDGLTVQVDVEQDEDFGLLIQAPALASLYLSGELTLLTYTSHHSVPSLVDASIHLPVIEAEELDYRKVEDNSPTEYQLYLLESLDSVTSLHLSHFGVMLLFYMDCLDNIVLENLRTLYLDECYISGGFLGVEHYLRNMPNLQKLTFHCCKIFDPRQSELTGCVHSHSDSLVDFKCENLRLTEIIYQDDYNDVHLLVMFLVGMSRNLPNNKMKLTQVD